MGTVLTDNAAEHEAAAFRTAAAHCIAAVQRFDD
jgi:hypothetical protein